MKIVRNVLAVIFAACVSAAYAADVTLEVTDLKDNVIVLQQARAYQESSSTIPSKVVTFDGIEMELGSGRVVIAWDKIDRLEKQMKDGKYETYDRRFAVYLTDGTKKDLSISNWVGLQHVAGKTDLGDYKIMIAELKLLKVVRTKK